MKITDLKSGKAFQLNTDTRLEIERPNLFFNEYGEQSLPVDLPDSDRNRELCGYPDMTGNRRRPPADTACSVSHGDYFMPARMAVLGARREESVTAAFYLNDGSFLAAVDDTPVAEVFGDETVPGVETVEQAIAFCRGLADGTGELTDRFAIFEVSAEGDGRTDEYGNEIMRPLNVYGFERDGRWWSMFDWKEGDGEPDFFYSRPRVETAEDGTRTRVPAGCYITPFIKANYLLRRVLAHFGYELQDNFFTRTEPFTDMVFVNNCLDALTAGPIRLADLVPDCGCGDLLNVFRKKFCCEFIADEVSHTVTVRLFNELLDEPPAADLTPYLVGEPKVEVPDEYKRITLGSEDVADTDSGKDENPSMTELRKHRDLMFSRRTDQYYYSRIRFEFNDTSNIYRGYSQSVCLTDAALGYREGGDLSEEEITVPDRQLSYRTTPGALTVEGFRLTTGGIYIGKGKYARTSLVNAETGEAEEAADEEREECRPMLAFSIRRQSYYYPDRTYSAGELSLSGYSLAYTGPDGIFERFYRRMDGLRRNSLLSVTANLLLPDGLKRGLSPHSPVSLRGQTLLPNVLKYAVGGKEEPVESTFLTRRLYEPLSQAAPALDGAKEEDGLEYRWVGQCQRVEINEAAYNAAELKDTDTVYLRPGYPDGKDFGDQFNPLVTVARKMWGNQYFLYRMYLTCEKKA